MSNKQYLSIVAGNDFELTAKVTQYDVVNSAYTDFDLTGCSQLCLFLVAVTGGRRYKIPVTIDGNILTAEIDGSLLSNGVYGLELLFEDADSHSKRSYEPALLKIVRSNAEATYSQADFDSEDDCRLHITVQTNTSFVCIGAPTADTQIDGTSYNAVSNAAVSDAINNLQSQIDTMGSEILDPASVYTKDETEALIDEMIDAQEMSDYVSSYVASYYTTTEQFDNSYNSLSERISAIEDNPTDISNLVSYNYLSEQSYLQASALDGLATQAYVDEKVASVDVSDQLADFVSKEEINNASYLQSDALNGYATESYVVEKIDAIAPTDLTEYVSKTFLSQQSYLQADDISDVVRDSDLASAGYITESDVAQMGYASTQFVTEQIEAIPQPDLSSYITETELNDTLSSYAQLSDLISNERVVSTALNSLADRIELVENDYVTDDELADAIEPLATEAYVAEKIDSISPADLTEYVSKQFLTQQGYITANDISDVVRDTDLSSAGYVTATDLSSAGYVTTTDLSSAGYVTTTDLSSAGYVTTTDLSSAGYVTNTDLSNAGYITETDLSNAGYITNTDLSSAGYVTTTDLSSAGYITETDLSNAGYVTTTNLNTTLTDYVTDSDLANAGYVTTTALDTALSSYAKVSDIENNEQVISTALNTLSDRIGLIENDYVSDDDLDDYATKSYVVEKIDALAPSDLNEYVSKNYLSQQGYITANDISDVVRDSDLESAGYVTATDLSSAGYVTATDLSSAGYVTTTELSSAGYVTATDLSSAGYITANDLSSAGYVTTTELSNAGYVTTTELSNASYVTETNLNTTLASYVTTTDVPYKFVVMSYADYTALATKDPNTFYCIPE